LLHRATAQWPIAVSEHPSVPGEPRVSFIIGHRGEERAHLLVKTLATIAAQNEVPVECIVVEQSARPVVKRRLPQWVRYVHTTIESDDLPYNRSATLNAGAALAKAPLLVLHDNDFLVPAAYASELTKRHDEGNDIIDLKRFMFYMRRDGNGVERVVQNLLAGGSVAVDRQAYFEIGGMDDSFVGWGGEDNEFWDRASIRRVFDFAYLPLVHQWHAPQPEKAANEATTAQPRLQELLAIPRQERIRRLRNRSF